VIKQQCYVEFDFRGLIASHLKEWDEENTNPQIIYLQDLPLPNLTDIRFVEIIKALMRSIRMIG
jgi:hypothetical protein